LLLGVRALLTAQVRCRGCGRRGATAARPRWTVSRGTAAPRSISIAFAACRLARTASYLPSWTFVAVSPPWSGLHLQLICGHAAPR